MSTKIVYFLKGQFTPKSKIHIFPLTCSAIYQSKLFWSELPIFGAISPFSNTMGLNGSLNVVLTAPKNIFEKLKNNVPFQKS